MLQLVALGRVISDDELRGLAGELSSIGFAGQLDTCSVVPPLYGWLRLSALFRGLHESMRAFAQRLPCLLSVLSYMSNHGWQALNSPCTKYGTFGQML